MKRIIREIELIPKIIGYNFFKKIGHPNLLPIILTLSVNDYCNSRCKTCNIWKNDIIKKRREELKLEEYEKIFENFDRIYWVTITGGEPFLRSDLPEIIKIIYKRTKPKVISLATNGILTKKIVSDTKKILNSCPKLNLIINLSLDGIGRQHDKIRGVKGCFNSVINTFKLLKKIKDKRLIIGINTVISRYNIESFFEIHKFVKKLNPDSFIVEIAENRAKLYNLDLRIVPKREKIKPILNFLIKENMKRKGISKLIKKLRREYYYFLLHKNSFTKKFQNFEGIASCYIMSNGEVWVSYVKRYVIGNLRDVNYDFKSIWFNKKAEKYRKIMEKNYSTTLANAFYTNFICNLNHFWKIVKIVVI